jgi:hypothetical protein
MPDQTPVTDDDRLAHQWADRLDGSKFASDSAQAAARAIRAHVPAPPATLADELREWLKAQYTCAILGFQWDHLAALADRVEAVEKENERLTARAEGLDSLVDSLNADLADARGPQPPQVHPATASAPALPDPDDVPEGEAWRVKALGRKCVGVRNNLDPNYPWTVISDDLSAEQYRDAGVTLVARLVPETRRVIDRPEDLDALPVGSIVLDKSGRPWCRIKDGYWAFGLDRYKADYMLHFSGPVTVIHEPMSDQGDCRTPDCPTQG